VVTISVSGGTSSGVGSGSVIRANGYILTNNHVIAPAASGGSLRVLFSNGTTAPANIVGRDPLTDLAVIKVTGASNLPVISLGSTSDLRVGDPVIALGAPLGYSSTVTSGIVSALDRTVSVPGESSQPALLVNAVQTDAAINPGNSGGALVDCSGRLVGVPSAGASVPSSSGGPPSSGNVGLGFAIPVDLAKTVSDEIIATGRVQRSYIGLDVEPIGSGGRGQNATGEGLLVTVVDSGGPAASAGLQTGDVITKIDDRTARTTDQLVAVLLAKRPGDSVTIAYDRQGRSATTRVTLGRQP
jgi:putative serine protease PepD